MQIGHQLGNLAMGCDQRIGHVIGVAGGIADSRQLRDVSQGVN